MCQIHYLAETISFKERTRPPQQCTLDRSSGPQAATGTSLGAPQISVPVPPSGMPTRAAASLPQAPAQTQEATESAASPTKMRVPLSLQGRAAPAQTSSGRFLSSRKPRAGRLQGHREPGRQPWLCAKPPAGLLGTGGSRASLYLQNLPCRPSSHLPACGLHVFTGRGVCL